MKKSVKRVHDDMNVLVFKKQSTMLRDLPPHFQVKCEEDAQRQQERRASELHGEISFGADERGLDDGQVCMVGFFAWELASFPPASELSSTACMARRGSGVMAFVFLEMSQEAPLALNRFERCVLLSYSAQRPEAVAPRPWWLSKVCNYGQAISRSRRRWPLTLGHIRTHTLASVTFSLTSLSSKATPSCTLLQARCIWEIPGWASMASGCHWLVSLRSSVRRRLQARRARPQRFAPMRRRSTLGSRMCLGVEQRQTHLARKQWVFLVKPGRSWKTTISSRRRRSLTQKRRPSSVRLWTSCIVRERMLL